MCVSLLMGQEPSPGARAKKERISHIAAQQKLADMARGAGEAINSLEHNVPVSPRGKRTPSRKLRAKTAKPTRELI